MLATPRPKVMPDSQRSPTEGPEPESEHRHPQMEQMSRLDTDKPLGVVAARAVSPESIVVGHGSG